MLKKLAARNGQRNFDTQKTLFFLCLEAILHKLFSHGTSVIYGVWNQLETVILLVIAIRLLLIGVFVRQLMFRIIHHVSVIFLFLVNLLRLSPPPPVPIVIFVIFIPIFFLWSSSSGSLSHFCDRYPLKVLCIICMIFILWFLVSIFCIVNLLSSLLW